MSKVYGSNWCNHDADCKVKHPKYPGLFMAKPGTAGVCDMKKNRCADAVSGGKSGKPAAGNKKKAPAKKKASS